MTRPASLPHRLTRGIRLLALGMATTFAALAAPASAQDAAALPDHVFARVDGTDLAAASFDREARESFRRKFYHGRPPEAEVDQMLRQVGQQLIDDHLVDAEAQRRKVAVDAAAVAAELAEIDRRNAGHPQWAADKAEALPLIQLQIERRHRLRNLEREIRSVSPDEGQIRRFYEARPDLFTEPPKLKVSAILIAVEPSARSEVWEKAKTDAAALIERLRKGEDFATLAKAHSRGPNAEGGGDLGFVHQGTLSPSAEEELGKAQVGEIVGPIMTLEGQGVFRLDDRQPARLMPFADVRERARSLLVRETAEKNWQAFLQGLRGRASIAIGPAFQRIMALPLPTDSGPPGIPAR